jgi:hypothetical protein
MTVKTAKLAKIRKTENAAKLGRVDAILAADKSGMTAATVRKLINARFALVTNGFNNVKIAKSNKSGRGVFTVILHLAPADNSGHEVCAFASAGCRRGCLYTAGFGRYDTVKNGRIRKTCLLRENREEFRALLVADLHKLVRLCDLHGLDPAVRLNGTSDVVWEREWPELFRLFPMIQFYDYTKNPGRLDYAHYLPDNYYLLFSRSEDNDDICDQLLEAGRANVAVVFEKTLPATWHGYPVFNADDDDLRYLDDIPTGAVAGLYAKGSARSDESGFVVRAT